MGLSMFKTPTRYEDIADVSVRLRPFQKLRLLLFLAVHPEEEEFERCKHAAETDLSTLSWESRVSCGNPRKKAQELRKAITALEKEMRSERKEQCRLENLLATQKRALGNVSIDGIEL